MNFRNTYKDAFSQLHARECCAEDIVRNARPKSSRAKGSIIKAAALSAALVLVTAVVNYRSVISFANTLFGTRLTAETSEGEKAALGTVKPVTDFDFTAFINSEGAVAEDTEINGEMLKSCNKVYEDYSSAEAELAEYGIKLPESDCLARYFSGEGSYLWLGFTYDEAENKGSDITIQFISSGKDGCIVQLMSEIDTNEESDYHESSISAPDYAEDSEIYTNANGKSFIIATHETENTPVLMYDITFTAHDLCYGLNISLTDRDALDQVKLREILDTIV